MEFRADLHMHSTLSDGSFTPLEILSLAKDANLSGISITDHDTAAAYTDKFFNQAKELEISILTGVEISSSFRKKNVHILAYGFDLKNNEFITFLQEVRKRRITRNEKILQKLKDKGFKLDKQDLKRDDLAVVGRPHIAQALIKNGYVKDFNEAFDLYLKDDKSCYVPLDGFEPTTVIDVIKQANGKAIIAHPHFLKESIAKDLLRMPFDGLEAYYAKLYPNQERRWVDIAKSKGWIITGGSDFHGSFKPHIPIGASWVGKETFDRLSYERST